MTEPQINVAGMPEFDALLDHIYEYGTASEGIIDRANAFARALLARYGNAAAHVHADDARDAARYRLLRRKVRLAGGEFHILNLDPRYIAQDSAAELDAAIDAAMRKEGK